jgi:GT2 family glycosyltransferase
MSTKIIGCFAGVNESEMVKLSISSVYEYLDEIIFVEGAIRGWFDSPTSTDDTIDVVRSLDKNHKITIVQHPSGDYWDSLELQKNEFCKRVNIGDWLLIDDCDEIYNGQDLLSIRKIIASRPKYQEIIPIFIEHYGSVRYCITPSPGRCNLTNQRLIRMQPGMHYSCHHPTACLDGHLDSALDPRYADRRIVIPDFFIHHLSWCKDTEFLIKKHMRYFTTFDKNPPAIARQRAEEKVESMKESILYYDGPLPEVLKNSRFNVDIPDMNCHNWLTALPYRYPQRIPNIFNTEYIPSPSFSVVITCYNNLDVLKVTLPAWKNQTYRDYEIIVVEDGEPDDVDNTGIKEYVESLGYKYLYNDSGASYCIASARNLGILAATKDRVLLSDSDIIAHEDFILEHAAEAQSNNITVGSRYRVSSAYNLDDAVVDPRVADAFVRITNNTCTDPHESCHGCNISYPRVKLISVNGFDEDYNNRWGAEDTDLAYRLIKKGIVVKPVPSSIGYHIEHPTRNTGGQRELLNQRIRSGEIVCKKPKSWK